MTRKKPPIDLARREEVVVLASAVDEAWETLWRAPSRMRLSDWADKYRQLSPESSAEPGQWVTAKAPYEREIMDAISDQWVQRVVIQKAAQLGITDSAILNPVGYFMDQDPCPMLVVQPTIEIAEVFSTDRLEPMLRDSPQLAGKVASPRARYSGNTMRRKAFRGGFVAMAGANSASSLSGRPIRVVLLDDVDRYPASAGTEGNPLQLAIARTTAFWNRKIVIVSSPGIRGVSHIEREMAESTQEHWYLPCPECGDYQILDWDRVVFGTPMTHRCLFCNVEAEKIYWLQGEGQWRAHRPLDERGNKVLIRGFYLGGLYNPWIDWDVLMVEFIRAAKASKDGDIEPLKAFKNTRLGLLFEESGQKVNVDLYKHRRETYDAEVPEGVLVLTAGVDTHEYGLNYEVVGWGKGSESWGIEYGIIDGDPREDEVWRLLDQAVYRRVFTHASGKMMRVRKMAVDSGYAADEVYAYTKPRQPRAISIKGEGGLRKPFIKGAGTLTKSNRARLQILGVDAGKEEITNRLMVSEVGNGYCHFPKLANGDPCRGYDEEYFAGLTAESRVVKEKDGFPTYRWIKRLSQRNEPFDCRNYALGAVRMPFQGIDLEKMKPDFYAPSKEKDDQPSRYGAVGSALPPDMQGVSKPSGTLRMGQKYGIQNRPLE